MNNFLRGCNFQYCAIRALVAPTDLEQSCILSSISLGVSFPSLFFPAAKGNRSLEQSGNVCR